MQRLEALLRRFAAQSEARWWIGPRPAVRDDLLAAAVAAKAGLPTVADDALTAGRMTALDRAAAARVLALAGTLSLAYDPPSPSQYAIDEAASALADLAPDAVFVSNGRWHAGTPIAWNPLTTATFDCGIIGADRAHAFVFWVEEED